MGVFIRKNGAWVNANDNLNIRSGSNLNGPTNANVPRVYAHRNKWVQIYPPTEQSTSTGYRNGSGYISWQGSKSDSPIWGWQQAISGSPGMTDEGGQGYFGTGNYYYELNVFKEYAGWMGMTTGAINPSGHKVKKVSKLTMEFNFLVTRYQYNSNGVWVKVYKYVGYPTVPKYIGIVATRVNSPTATNADSANPTISGNRSTVFGSDQSLPTNGTAVTFTWTNPNALEMVRQVMCGENGYKNICTYNGSRPNSDLSNCYHTSSTTYTYDYTRFSSVRYNIEYTYQP